LAVCLVGDVGLPDKAASPDGVNQATGIIGLVIGALNEKHGYSGNENLINQNPKSMLFW